MISKSLSSVAAFALIIKVLSAIITYAFVLLLAKVMNVNDFGVIGTLLTASLLLSVLGAFGQRMALLRFVPPLLEIKDRNALAGQITRSFSLAAKGNFLIYLIVAAGISFYFPNSDVYNWSTLLIGACLIPLVAWIDMQSHLARAYRSVALALIPKDVLWRLTSGITIVMVYFLTDQQVVSLEIAVYVLVATIAILATFQAKLMWGRLKIPSLKPGVSHSASNQWRKSIVPFSISSVGSLTFSNLDVMLVGVLLGAEKAAFYFAANRLSQVLSFFLMSYNIVIGPIISEDHAAGRIKKVKRVTAIAALQTFVPTAIVAAILYLAAPLFLQIFGSEYVVGVLALQILIVSGLVNTCLGPGDILLNMCGYEKTAMYVSLYSTIIGALILLVFCLFWGINGMATGVLVSISLRKILFWTETHRKMGVKCDIFSSLLYLLR